jgi:hypothetical protein
MALQSIPSVPVSAPPALPGTWKLAPGRAISLRPREAGQLRIAHGLVWATFDGPHYGPLNDPGDHIVGAGEQLRVEAGQRLVIEAWNAALPTYFSWDPVAEVAVERSRRMAPVGQSLADLREALALGAGATGRLVAALAGLAAGLVTGGRQPTRGLNAPAGACGAHGAMG